MSVEKKRLLFFLFCFAVVLVLSSLTDALMGVSPAIFKVNFQPNLKQTFHFNFFSDGNTLEVYAEGDLANYTKLSATRLDGGGGVDVTLNLPSQIEIPGSHRIFVGAKPFLEGGGAGFTAVESVRGVIDIFVPYPGKYAEIRFSGKNANAGQPVEFKLLINNLGWEPISTSNRIEIYDFSGNLKTILPLDSKVLQPSESAELTALLDTKGYNPGDYTAVVYVDYGAKIAKAEAIFRIGEMRVGIKNITDIFSRGKINRIEIEIESFWNDPMENVYVNGNIVGYDISFTTPSTTLSGFGSSMLTGFFDTTDIKEDNFKINAIVHYNGKISNKMFDVKFEKKDMTVYYYLAGGILTVLIVLALIVWIILRRKKDEAKKGKR